MKVLVIPEDFRKDQFMLKPIIEAMLVYLGNPRSKVTILKDPLRGGVDQALNLEQLTAIVERYRMVDLFLLCIDRDGDPNRRQRLDLLEAEISTRLPADKRFLAANAWQEIEVWVLAGLDRPREWSWQEIRLHRDPKEHYFRRLAETRGLLAEPGEGRKTLGLEAAKLYRQRIRRLCREDIWALETRIKQAS